MSENFLESFGEKVERVVRKWMPDPFVLVLLLTLIAFSAALWFTPTSSTNLVVSWNAGFWELLSFAMQMVLIVVTGEAIVESPMIKAGLKKICSFPKSVSSALWFMTFFSMVLGWLHWGLGLVFSSLMARELGKNLERKKIHIHYPLLGAAAYMSMLLWHAGTTASAPLLINTPGHFLFKEIGLVPLSETIFLKSNLITCAFLALTVPFLIVQLHPRKKLVRTASDYALVDEKVFQTSREKPCSFSEKIENSYLLNALIGILGFAFLIPYFQKSGMNLNHNVVNFLFLFLGILLHRSPISYAQAISKSLKGTAGIVLQFPFYGGIMGMMKDSGLGHLIAQVFIEHSTSQTLPVMAYLSSVATKFFIPSGGGEWAVEGPVLLQAAKELHSSIGLTTMGIAYGNMVGNLFQPFWAIPLLSIMGLQAKEIMGTCLMIFFYAFPILAFALWAS